MEPTRLGTSDGLDDWDGAARIWACSVNRTCTADPVHSEMDNSAIAYPACSPSPVQCSPTTSQKTVVSGAISRPAKNPNSRKACKDRQHSRPVITPVCVQVAHLPTQPNRNKWAIPASDLMPAVCTEWHTAVRTVNRDVKCRTLLSKARAGIMFPDPAYLVSTAPANRSLVIAAWLSIQPACCGQMLYPACPMIPVIPAAVWDHFFLIYRRQPRTRDDLSVPPSNTGDPVVNTELDTATVAAKAMFRHDLVCTMNNTSREVYWLDKAYDMVDSGVVGMGPYQVREIVWEFAELNWRYKLFTLDKYATPHMWLDGDAAADQVSTILPVFRHSSFVLTHAVFLASNFSIAAPTCAECFPAFNVLRRIMSAWAGCPVSSSDCPETRVVEVQTMLFYCQSFYEYFRRPPVLPCQLPIS